MPQLVHLSYGLGMRSILLVLPALALACTIHTTPSGNSTPSDVGLRRDATPVADSGSTLDAATLDASPADATPGDSGASQDAAAADATTPDLGFADTGVNDTGPAAAFEFFTPAWIDGGMVPSQYTCDGPGGWPHQNNPALVWANPPAGTAGFVMIFDDPDAGNWRHWAFFTADASLTGVPESSSNTAALPSGVTELRSGDNRRGYVPNCPGGNRHEYRWRLWAVNTANLGVTASSSFSALERAAENAKIEMIQFFGVSTAGR